MCGRYGIESDVIGQVGEDLNATFQFDSAPNICPSELLGCLIKTEQGLQQLNAKWGIKPSWSKKLLINAQAETASIKSTFRHSFLNYRCIIPMSYWFEWSQFEGQKIKYQFSDRENKPLYMAGLFFPTDTETNVVSLTVSPTEQCKQYHHRMPFIVNDYIEQWLNDGDIHHNLTTKFKVSKGTRHVQTSLFDSY